jgi:hypothetical protein
LDRIKAIDHEKDAYMCTLRLNNLEAEKVKALEEINEPSRPEQSNMTKGNILEIIKEDGVYEEDVDRSADKRKEMNYNQELQVSEPVILGDVGSSEIHVGTNNVRETPISNVD